MGPPRARRSGYRGATLTVSTVPTKLAHQQIASLPVGKAKASVLLAVEDIRRSGCAAAGVRLAGEALSGICRLDLYGAWRLLTVFEAPDRCVLLLVAEHTRSANPYRLLYGALGIDEPEEPRTKPSCCDAEGQPPIHPDLVTRFERGLRDLGRTLPASAKTPSRRRR
jgi:hypothetical protein